MSTYFDLIMIPLQLFNCILHDLLFYAFFLWPFWPQTRRKKFMMSKKLLL